MSLSLADLLNDDDDEVPLEKANQSGLAPIHILNAAHRATGAVAASAARTAFVAKDGEVREFGPHPSTVAGIDFSKELIRDPVAKAKLQTAVDKIYPIIPSFFGRSKSKNSEMYRRWGIKLRSNEEMRADYIQRAAAACAPLSLTLPALPAEPLH